MGLSDCWASFQEIRWRAVIGKIALSVAIAGFFLNTVIASPWDEFQDFNSYTDVNKRVHAVMSIISIGSGALMVFLGVWAKTKKQWRLVAAIGFIAWCSNTVYIGYETEWNGSTSPTWFFVFGWAGVGCYKTFEIYLTLNLIFFLKLTFSNIFFHFAATVLSIMADKNHHHFATPSITGEV